VDFILYESVNIKDDLTAFLFVRTIDHKSPSIFSSHVKFLCIACDLEIYTARILAACSGIYSLDYWSRFLARNSIELKFPRLRRLTVILLVEQPNFLISVFANLTHLFVYDGWEKWSTWYWEGLHNVTHLSLSLAMYGIQWKESVLTEAVRRIFSQCPRLRVCIMRVELQSEVDFCEGDQRSRGLGMLKRIGDNDPRLVVFKPGPAYDRSTDWHSHMTGKSDCYDWAEDLVRMRRAQSDA
jgi:hypothetical protein